MNILIVGEGKQLYFLCRTFLSKGYHVTIVDRDHQECLWLSSHLKATVVHGDGSDSRILEEAGARHADAILAITARDQDNLAVCQLAVLHFDVPKAIAVVHDPDNEEAFRRLGIDAFSTTRTIASLIEQKAGLEQITNLIPAGEGKVNITEVVLTESSPVAGRLLREIALPEGSLVASVLRHGEPIVPRGSTEVLAGDRLVLITVPESHGPALRAITGEER